MENRFKTIDDLITNKRNKLKKYNAFYLIVKILTAAEALLCVHQIIEVVQEQQRAYSQGYVYNVPWLKLLLCLILIMIMIMILIFKRYWLRKEFFLLVDTYKYSGNKFIFTTRLENDNVEYIIINEPISIRFSDISQSYYIKLSNAEVYEEFWFRQQDNIANAEKKEFFSSQHLANEIEAEYTPVVSALFKFKV